MHFVMKTMYQHYQKNNKRRNGQAMIIAILTLGGAILGATTLAGLLLLYQIRSTTDSESSAKAIFAADSGVNWALYSYFNSPQPQSGASSTLSNGASYLVTCSDDTGATIDCDTSATTTAISEGDYNGSRRAFFFDLSGATGTFP
jgi:hypothetical protein